MTLMEHRFGLSWKWLLGIIITIFFLPQWRRTVELASKSQRQRSESLSTKICMCIHMCAHTHTCTYTSLAVSFAIHETLNWEDFFKGISVCWQTHKSFYFSAIKQKSFLNHWNLWVSVHLANVPHTEINLLSSLTGSSYSLNVCILQCSSRGPPIWILLSLKLPCQSAALSIYVHLLGALPV